MKNCTGMRRGSLRQEFPQPIPVDTVISNGALRIAVIWILCVVGALIILWL